MSEAVADRLGRRGVRGQLTSRYRSRLLRVIDILATILISRWRYDVAHIDVYSGAAFLWAEWAGRLLVYLKKPYVVTLHGGDLPQFVNKHRERVERLVIKAASVVAPSNYLAETVLSIRPDIKIVPNAIDIGVYHFRIRDRVEPKLVWLRAFHKLYEPMLAIRTLAILSGTNSRATLTMIGPDKDGELSEVMREVRRLGLQDRVTFVGAVSKTEVPRYLAEGDIFMNTSTIDNSPVSVVEAMASGLAVVSTNVGGIPYLVEDGTNGLLVPPGDPDSMAAAIGRLLTEAGLATRLSRNARERVESFDWDSVVPIWEAIIMKAANDGGSEQCMMR